MVDEWPGSIPKSPTSWISIKIGLWVEKWIRTKQRPGRQEMTLGHEWYDANQWVESNPAHYPPFLRTSNKVQMCRSSTIWWAVHENEAPICWWAAVEGLEFRTAIGENFLFSQQRQFERWGARRQLHYLDKVRNVAFWNMYPWEGEKEVVRMVIHGPYQTSSVASVVREHCRGDRVERHFVVKWLQQCWLVTPVTSL